MEVDDDLHTLLNEQRREIASADAVDFDFLFAIQLQMQEAMNASSSKPIINADVIGSNNVSNLFAEELSYYEQQVIDHQTAEAEMRKIEDDLNRRIHDQAFAREILNVPEGEWKETGDHLHRPYGEDSSKGVTQNGECFRVYVKGLMGEDAEDVVGVVGRNLAGIGVAVCDPSGILVFVVSKNLVKGTQVLIDEIAELKALIEGLDIALMLGLKRVNVVLDSQTILQYQTIYGSNQALGGKKEEKYCLLHTNFPCLGCGHEFCYTCGAEWKNKKPTCTCPVWDERNIIYDNRRQPRRG